MGPSNGLDTTPYNGFDKILPALAVVKSELQAVTKKTNNPFFKSKYADLNTYLEEVEPLLEKNGLMLLQPVSTAYTQTGLENVVTSKIIHIVSGQVIESSMKLVGGADMQKLGSGVTYARRYTLGSLLSMKAEDDDGNKASDKEHAPAKSYSKPSVVTTQAETTSSVSAQEVKPSNRPSFRKPAKTEVVAATEVSSGDDL